MTNYRDRFRNGTTKKLSSIDEIKKEKLFQNKSIRILTPQNEEVFLTEAESEKFVKAYIKQKSRYIPDIDYNNPETFAFFGSAEKYYENSVNHIYSSYPYDGSKAEKMEWAISASFLDLYVFEHEYPKSTGHVKFVRSSDTGGGSYYRTFQTPRYITFSGGPQLGTIYNAGKNREGNLKIDGTTGNTIEFWMRKDSGTFQTSTRREVIFDIASSAPGRDATSGANYGRLTVELQNPASATDSPFMIAHRSGSTGTSTGGANFGKRLGSSKVTPSSVADGKWHHYAITMQTDSTNTTYKFYVDGQLDHETQESYVIGALNTPMTGAIGALSTHTSVTALGGIGQGQLSASVDELRFWKSTRTEKEIGRFWYQPIHGGTDKDHTNASLGLYYKFNEGITSQKDHDEVILDYSGRINNGKFVNWNSLVREADSGIDKSQYLPESNFNEIKDPIINPLNSQVQSVLGDLKKTGKSYDLNNGSSLVRSVPSHLNDEDENLFPELLQIMASSFDEMFVKIKHLPSIKNYDYKEFFEEKGQYRASPTNNFLLGCEDEVLFEFTGDHTKPWMNHIIEHYGLVSTEIFPNATTFENFFNRTEKLTFEHNLEEVKREILSNIHKNLIHIFKVKGTESSFRNLIRCFGVDDELIKLNSYGNNLEYELKKKPHYTTVKQKSLSFEGQNYQASLHNIASSTNSLGHITGSDKATPYTLEANIIFPKKIDKDQVKVNPVSLFGMHSVDVLNSSGPLTFDSEDSGSFQVKFVKRKFDSTDGYFELTSSTGVITALTSSYIPGVYENSHWNISVRIGAKSDIDFNIPPVPDDSYLVEFTGYNYDLDVLQNSFSTNTSITKEVYDKISLQDKGVFVGSHKTNFTGTHLMDSDIRVLGFNVWKDCLTEHELQEHAQNPETFGRDKPQSISNFDAGQNLLATDSLVLRWQFQNLTGSDDSNIIAVTDYSSGSNISVLDDDVSGFMLPGQVIGAVLGTSSVFQEFIPAVRYSGIDNVYSSDRVKVKTLELEKFEADSRPVTYFYNFEKSMYQVVSQEMMSFFAGVTGYNNMIGEPVNKYREKYKLMEKVRQRFFSKVNNDMDLDKFIEYYKWIDDSLSHFLYQLVPASARFGSGIKDVIESHILERNKYRHKAPTVEFKDPADKTFPILGVNELLYDWEHGHAPIGESDDRNCLWQKERRDRDPHDTSDNLRNERETLRRISITEVSGSTYALRRLTKPYKFTAKNVNTITTGQNRPANKNSEFYKIINTGKTIATKGSGLDARPKCQDLIEPNQLRTYSGKSDTSNTEGYLDADSDLILPFIFVSSSGARDLPDFKLNMEIANDKLPDNISGEASLQSPFTETHVGGMPHGKYQYRNTITDTADDNNNRPEAYNLHVDNGSLIISQPSAHKPKSMFYNDVQGTHFANIRNIKHDTSSVSLGNYNKSYEIVMTNGREVNNAYFVKTEGQGIVALEAPVSSQHLSGAVDFKVPDRGRTEHVIVNKFSAPGSPESMCPAGLDRESEEYSIYNTINYRNTVVREVENRFSLMKSNQFGHSSEAFATATLAVNSIASLANLTLRLTNADGTTHDITATALGGGNPSNATQINTDLISSFDNFGTQLKASLDAAVAAGNLDMTVSALGAGSGPPYGFVTLTQNTSGIDGNRIIEGTLVSGFKIVVNNIASSAHGTKSFLGGAFVPVSKHKTNRNPNKLKYTNDDKKFDNFYVQHHIPQNDYGYSWITASANESIYNFLSKNMNHGHQHGFGIPGTLRSSQTIDFATASHVAVIVDNINGIYFFGGEADRTFPTNNYARESAEIDFAGLNTVIVQAIDDSNNTVGTDTILHYINYGSTGPDKRPKTPWHPPTAPVSVGDAAQYPYLFFMEHPDLNNGGISGGSFRSGSFMFEDPTQRTPGALLNAITLNRQGPYGWPTWKQLRTSEHIISRRQRQNNIISLSVRDSVNGSSTANEELFPKVLQEYEYSTNKNLSNLNNNETVKLKRRFRRYNEMMATGRFNALTITLHGRQANDLVVSPISQTQHEAYWINDETSLVALGTDNIQPAETLGPRNSRLASIKATYGNDTTAFANSSLTRKLKISEIPRKQTSDLLRRLGSITLDGDVQATEVNYIETLYPREINTYSHKARIRELFDFQDWRLSRDARNKDLTGNTHDLNTVTLKDGNFLIAPSIEVDHFDEYNTNGFGVSALDVTYLEATPKTLMQIAQSRWPLDARKDFTEQPASLKESFLASTRYAGSNLNVKTNGTRGEGVLQNDYSIFGMGYNALHGTPPPAMVYNRRIPQTSGSAAHANRITVLAGEAKWEAAEQSGYYPFADNFDEHSENFRQIGQDHSLVPEFKISDHIEDIINNKDGNLFSVRESDKFLSLTGAVFDRNSTDLQVSKTFFKTYGTSDFMKYFGFVKDDVEESNLGKATKLTLRCKAAMKFTPYRGFYPAQRVVQIGSIFSRGYMPDFTFSTLAASNAFVNDPGGALRKKVRANLQQCMKPLFAPGVLMNSIKSGMAVDYPLFGSAADEAVLLGSYTTAVANRTMTKILEEREANFVPADGAFPFPDELNSLNMFTGSLIVSDDSDISSSLAPPNDPHAQPRLTGSVYRRITFEDVLNPENLVGLSMLDQEPHPSASIYYADRSLGKLFDYPFKFGQLNERNNTNNLLIDSFRLNKSMADTLKPYRLAINNFCSETVKFFLKDEKLATLESEEVYPYLKNNEVYKMRVYIRNNNTRMYDRHSAFGPPVDEGDQLRFTKSTVSTSTAVPGASGSAVISGRSALTTIGGTPNVFGGGVIGGTTVLRASPFEVTGSSLRGASYNADNEQPHFAITSSGGETMRISVFSSGGSFDPWDEHGSNQNAMKMSLTFMDGTDQWQETGFSDTYPKDALYHHSASTGLNLYLDIDKIEEAGTSADDHRDEQNKMMALIHAGICYYSRNISIAHNNKFGIDSILNEGTSTATGLKSITLTQREPGTNGNTAITNNGMSDFLNIPSTFADGNNPGGTTTTFSTTTQLVDNSHGFAPYHPPYLDPGSEPYVEIAITASASKHYTLQEIFDNATFDYYNFASEPNNIDANSNFKEAMALSASIDLNKYVVYNVPSDRPADQNREERYRWVIQSKWETPVLNFIEATASALDLNYSEVLQVSGESPWQKRQWNNYYNFEIFEDKDLKEHPGNYRKLLTGSIGMWHQFGKLPTSEEEGYTISVETSPDVDSGHQLSKKVGFNADKGNTSVKVGRMSDRKVVSEAVIAIPFIEPKVSTGDDGEDNMGAVEFFNIKSHVLEAAYRLNLQEKERHLETLRNPNTNDGQRITAKREYNDWYNRPGQEPISSAAYQMRMMEKFILPPQFDYVSSGQMNSENSVKPMMYVFQFNAEFDKEDLSNIWQNLSPKSKTSAAELRYSTVRLQSKIAGQVQDVQYVSNFLDERLCPFSAEAFLGSKKVRWLIFKAKQRASFDLGKTRQESLPSFVKESRPVEVSSIEPTKELLEQNYSYNWPYDFFSIVELVKFESKVDFFKGVNFAEVEATGPAGGVPPFGGG